MKNTLPSLLSLPLALFLFLSTGAASAQGLVFQNRYKQGEHLLSDDLVIPQGKYVNRGRILVAGEGAWWAKSGTLAQLRPESWLAGAWVWRNGRAYVGDYWFFTGSNDTVLVLRNEETQRELRIRTDDTAPELAVFLSPAGAIEADKLLFSDGAKLHFAAHDGGSGLDGIYWSPAARSGGAPVDGKGRLYAGPFAPEAGVTAVEVVARDRVGNELSRRYELVRDNEPPEALVRILSPDTNWQLVANDAVEFQAPPLELAVIGRDNRDAKPIVLVSIGGVGQFRPLRETLKVQADTVFHYCAVDASGNRSPTWRFRAVLRETLPLLQAK